mgnify:CR=1 FL=1
MAEWTQKEMEELLAKMNKKAMTDTEFRKEVLTDATKALEKLAGKPLPEGASLKCIERDPNYQATFVLPDLIDEDKLDDEALSQVAGGISVALIASVCAVAGGIGPDVVVCGGRACVGDLCVAQVCGGDAKVWDGCAVDVCGADAETESNCSIDACGAKACGTHRGYGGCKHACGAKHCDSFCSSLNYNP